MRIIAKRTLRAYWEREPRAEQPLKAWYAIAAKADWSSSADVKAVYGNASIVGNDGVIFNIGGNRYPTRSCERFLSEREFVRLGTVLDELEAKGKISATAAAGLRLLMLTGCRRNEILTLRWEDVDLEHDELRLRDAKTGVNFLPMPVESLQCHTMPN